MWKEAGRSHYGLRSTPASAQNMKQQLNPVKRQAQKFPFSLLIVMINRIHS